MGKAEMQDNRFCVTDMQIAVGLRGKSRDYSAAVLAGCSVCRHNGADEIGPSGGRRQSHTVLILGAIVVAAMTMWSRSTMSTLYVYVAAW